MSTAPSPVPWSGPIALIAGALLPLAFAPVGLWPIALLSVAALFWVLAEAPPGGAFRDGYLFGLGQFGIGVSWVYISIHDMGHLALWLAALITGVFIAFLALYPALLGYLAARLAPRGRPDAPLARVALLLPAGWVALEGVRGVVLTGFPWLLLGHTQSDGPLRGLAPVLGTPGISLVLALSAGWLLALRYARGWHREGLVLLLVALWAGAYALTDRQWTRVDGEPLSVSLIQGALPQHARWSMEQRGRSVAHYLALTEDEWGRDLILWPENALPLFHHEVEKLRAELGERAAASGSTLLTGMPYMELDTWRYFNAVVALPEPSPRYYKHHLVPFTEYLPMKRALAGLVDFFQVPMSDFSHGPEGQPPMELAGLPVGATVCYEAAYPSEVLGPLPEARLLVNISNDGWFGNSLAPHQHLQIARLRALEAGRWLLRATNTGISALIAPDGSVTARTPQFETTVLRGEVTPMAGATPYVRWRDWPVAALILVIAALGVWSARRGTARE